MEGRRESRMNTGRNQRSEKSVDMTEAISIEMLGRKAVSTAMVLEDLDLMVDCNRNRLVPYQGTWDQPVFRV
jgi:hypothetical protein